MTGKYKHYKRENSASAVYETKQENKVDSFVKYILCFFALSSPILLFYFISQNYGLFGIFTPLGIFATIFSFIIFCIIALIFYDNKNKDNITQKLGIILYLFLAISTTTVCITQPFSETYHCKNNVCKVTTSSFLKDKELPALSITNEIKTIGMNTKLDNSSKTTTGLILEIIQTFSYALDIKNTKKIKEANGKYIKVKSIHGLYGIVLILFSCIFIIPMLYFLYCEKRKLFYIFVLIVLSRLTYIFLFL